MNEKDFVAVDLATLIRTKNALERAINTMDTLNMFLSDERVQGAINEAKHVLSELGQLDVEDLGG